MHFKSLHNFLLIVLCTIGIGFASAPPAAAALTFADGTTAKKDLWLTVTSPNTSKANSFNVKGSASTGAPSVAFSSHSDELKAGVVSKGNNEYQVTITFTPKAYIETTQTAPITVSMPGESNTLTVNLKLTYKKPQATTGTITLDKSAFDLNANKTIDEWKTNGKLVRELTVTGTNVSGDITLTISPAGNGLSVTPTTLPHNGGKVTITYKPSAGNTVNDTYPKLSVSAANATTQTVELRTQWDGSTHATGVTAVPTIPAGTFDPDIYECKTFKGRTTVSLRWELKNPDDIELKSYSQSAIDSELDEPTKARMIAWNEAYDKYSAMTYTLFRDGKEIVSDLDITSYVDMNVPEGDHKYYVVTHYRNGIRTASSEEKTVKVKRDMAITNYVLEEIYNYPIVNEEEYNKLTDKTKSFKAFGTVEGDDGDVNREGFVYKYNFDGKGDPLDPNQAQASGARGDGVRQGVFCNGQWYIAMVSNRKAEKWVDPQGKDLTDRKANALGYAAKEYPSDELKYSYSEDDTKVLSFLRF